MPSPGNPRPPQLPNLNDAVSGNSQRRKDAGARLNWGSMKEANAQRDCPSARQQLASSRQESISRRPRNARFWNAIMNINTLLDVGTAFVGESRPTLEARRTRQRDDAILRHRSFLSRRKLIFGQRFTLLSVSSLIIICIFLGAAGLVSADRLRGQLPDTRLPVPSGRKPPDAPNSGESSSSSALGSDSTHLQPNIVGGTPVAAQNEYPWLALIYDSVRGVMCGGSLIANNLLVTAAHCSIGSSARNWRVLTYRRDISYTTAEEGGIRYTVTRIVLHPLYDDNSLTYDVALFMLSAPENFGGFSPAWIQINRDPYIPQPGEIARVIGWGVLSYQGTAPDILQQVDIATASAETCKQQLGNAISDPTYLCAGSPGKDSCQGDSGGPLMVLRNGSWLLIGTVSFGTAGCADPVKYLAVYSKISEMAAWIDGIAEEINGAAATTAPVPTVTLTKIKTATVYVSKTLISTATIERTKTATRTATRIVKSTLTAFRTATTTLTIAKRTIYKTRTVRENVGTRLTTLLGR